MTMKTKKQMRGGRDVVWNTKNMADKIKAIILSDSIDIAGPKYFGTPFCFKNYRVSP